MTNQSDLPNEAHQVLQLVKGESIIQTKDCMYKILLRVMIPLIVGILIYVFFRKTSDLQIVTFWGFNGLPKAAFSIPSFLTYNLPDGLWLYAFTNAIILVWESELNSKSAVWIFMIPAIGFLTEWLQAQQWFMGTYDSIDLVTYAVAMLFALNSAKFNFFF
jgi:hypothetical protein